MTGRVVVGGEALVDLVPLDVSQFTRCGGGIHCLTMPLARRPV